DVETDSRTQLVLKADVALPVVSTMAPPGEHVGRVLGRARIVPAEVQIRNRPALAVLQWTGEVAIRHIVAVDVVPVPSDLIDGTVHRMKRGRDVDCLPGHVSSDVAFDRRPAIAEQIVRRANPRVDVGPARQAWNRIELPGRHERPR